MRYVVFDLETQNIFTDVGSSDPSALDISVASAYDSETDSYTTVTVDEIEKLWPIFERADALVGYNSNHFDIPLLNKYYPGDLTKIRSIDLMVEVQKVLGRRIRLQSLAEATLKVGKSGNGLESVKWWNEGLYEKVREYCIQDVKITRDLYDIALTKGSLKYKDLKDIRDIKVDTSKWQIEPEPSAFTHTLGL